MARSEPTFEKLRGEYAALWAECELRDDKRRTLEATARRIFANRPRYDNVSKRTGVPWYVVGIIHQMECGLSFGKHLHNGDPLSARTRLVPAGRPAVWPAVGQDAWEASAGDALTMPGKSFDKITDWSVERIAYVFEKYNGFGYRYKRINSAYLWSMTTHYKAGKYVADHVWSATAVSKQSGAMALLKVMTEMDPLSVDLKVPEDVRSWPKAAAEPVGAAATTPAAEAVRSRSVWALVSSFFLGIVNWFTDWLHGFADMVSGWFALVPNINTEVQDVLTPLTSLGTTLKLNIGSIGAVVAGVLVIIAIVRHATDKAELVQRRAADDEGV